MSLSDEQIAYLREYIRTLYGSRCVRCNRFPARTVHEIESRASRPADWWALENMVVLCNECHDWAHHHPAIAPEILRICQEAALYGKPIGNLIEILGRQK